MDRILKPVPFRTIQAWIEQTALSSGALFRLINRHGRAQPGRLSGIDVARVLKKLARRAGLDAATYAGHLSAHAPLRPRS